MKKRIAAAMACALLLTACSGGGAGTLSAVQKAGTVRIGILPDAPGYSAPNAEGAYVGAEVSLAKELAAAWGVQLQIFPVEPDMMDDYIVAEQLDLAIGRLANSSSLQYNVGTSIAYDSGMLYVVSRRGDYRTTKGSLENSNVGVSAGISDSYRVEIGSVAGITMTDVDSAASAADLLKSEQLSAYLCYESDALELLGDSALQIETISNVSPEEYVVIFNKTASDMKAGLDGIISTMISDGRMDELFQ